MKATYDALCTHGYAGLTIQRIGDEFPKSKSLVYHHYDGKDDLLLDFLAYLLEHFETSVPRADYPDAAAQLMALLDHVLPDDLATDRRDFIRAMAELRAQAAHDPAYRAHFAESTRFFRNRIATIVERGIDEGVFREVDPDRVAALLLATIDGARLQCVTADADATLPVVRAELQTYLETHLFTDREAAE